MSSLQRTLDTSFGTLARHIDEIIEYFEKSIEPREGYEYLTKLSGTVSFRKASAVYSFDDVVGLKDAVLEQDVRDVHLWDIRLRIEERSKGRDYARNEIVDVIFRASPRSEGVEVTINNRPFTVARGQIDVAASILEGAGYIKAADDEQKKCDFAIQKIAAILGELPDFQSRIRRSLANEKEVQDFLFPILKSHFSTLQEEDYLSKVAGTASKPDFGIEDLGIAIEVKFTSKHKSFKQLQVEINDDSRKYFGKTSPFKVMIVLIYNGSSEPTPANYVSDLEHMDVISKVIVSPFIVPRER